MDQQKLLGYFIEETKENLETIEQGILDLSSAVEDVERINEMFRAAHTVKGGAGMLGYSSIQKAAHRLEDAFKVLRENPQGMSVDHKLESLFLGGFDVLKDLVDKLQGTFGLKDEDAMLIVEAAEPTFSQLQGYLNHLLDQAESAPQGSQKAPDASVDARGLLKAMLNIFKQSATPNNRAELQQLCEQLSHTAPQDNSWQTLVKCAQTAIANPAHSYRTLAPIIIKELKQGSDYLELGKSAGEISSSNELKRLAVAKYPQILLTVDPQAIALALRQVFTQQQIRQLSQLLNAK